MLLFMPVFLNKILFKLTMVY